MKILIVDDDPITLDVLDNFSETLGFEVLKANNGKEAWELWQNHKTSIVITDILMPELDGFSLCQHIRNNEIGVYTYIIILTIANSSESIAKGMQIGADDYLIKPVDFETLHYRLKAATRIVNLISELKRTKNDLIKKQIELTFITERQHVELIQAKQVANIANLAKRDFLATISHELRTPMNGIIGIASLLQETRLNETQIKYTTILNNSANELLKLINDIINFTRIESGDLLVEYSNFDLQMLIDDLMKQFLPKSNKKNIELTCDIKENVELQLCGDSGKLFNILQQLLDNAIKFTHQGKITMNVFTNPLHDNCIKLNISISDSGIGISDENLQKLFQLFYRADTSLTRKYPGLGIGLATCQRLIEMMGGNIHVKSKYGVGTTVWLSLIFEKQSHKEPVTDQINRVPVVQHHKQPSSKSSSGLQAHILVVEDTYETQMIVQAILEKEKYNVDFASNGKIAIQMLESIPYDLVLMDIMMPDMDGLELTKKIRNQEIQLHTQDIPIIAMTAYGLDGDKERFLKSGMSGYLSKPFTADDLRQTVEQALFLRTLNHPTISEHQSEKLEKKQPSETEINDTPIFFNHQELLERTNNNPELIKQLIHRFLSDIPNRIKSIKDACQTNELDRIEMLAHTIKGASANLSLKSMQKAADRLESFAHKKEQTLMPHLILELEHQFFILQSILSEYIADQK